MTKPDPAQLLAAAPSPTATQGNSPWAAAKARELKDLIQRYSARRPRSLQRHLGPSELAVECDRQVVGKLVGEEPTNHVTDPWASFMGTAGHAEMENVLAWENSVLGYVRYISEQRVHPPGPFAEHSGTADCTDLVDKTLLDWKFLGKTSLDKVKSPAGPPRKYQGQVAIYTLALISMGYDVNRMALVAWPRTSSFLNDLYVWEQPFDDTTVALLTEVADDTRRRKAWAQMVQDRQMSLSMVPVAPDSSECYFCPFYRPGMADGVGCPGPKLETAA